MKRILCYGDSNTWGYRPILGTRCDSGTRWPARLASLTGREVAEEGLNGRTTVFFDADGLHMTPQGHANLAAAVADIILK